MQCFCELPCSTTSDELLVCHYYTANVRPTVCLFILHNVNIPHFENVTMPVACQCARCLATLSIAKRTSYDNSVLVPFDHVHCHTCGNFCTLKQSNRSNANQFRFFIACASVFPSARAQSNACQKFFAWADNLRTTPNRLIAQHINRLPVEKRKNDDDDNDETKAIRSQQISSSNNGQGDTD